MGERPRAGARALDGIRVLEFSAAMAGPWIGRIMAHSGADVIRVESMRRPDVVRLYIPPRAPEQGIQPQCSPWFTEWNAGKRFVALDLTRPAGVELAKRLVARCDVVIENYATGVLDKLGLGYAALRTVHEQVIMLSTSGFGDTGPCARHVTWGPNIEALAGLATLSGFPHRECTITQYAYPDVLSALHGLFAVLCALDHRRRTGRGQYVNLSQYEATVAAIGDVMMEQLANDRDPPRLGNASRAVAPHGCYRCRGDDAWCAIAVETDVHWEGLCGVLARPAWRSDPRFVSNATRLANASALDDLIEEWTRERSPTEVMALLQSAGVPAGVVQTAADHFRADPQLDARGFLERVEHAVRGTVVATGVPLRFSSTPGQTGRAGAAVGEDNDDIFGGILDMTADEIRAYVEAGAIEGPDR